MTSILVSRHHIKKSHALYGECDFLCFVSKNLYNHCLYKIRNYAFLKDDHGFQPSQEVADLRVKQQDSKNQNINEKNSQDDTIGSNNNFYLGAYNSQNKSGESKTKKRYAFETSELYPVIQSSPEFRTKNHMDYFGRSINTKILKQTIRQVQQDFSNFFASMKAYKISPESFLGKPKLPFYKTVGSKGRTVCTVPSEAISVNTKKNTLSFGGTSISFSLSDIKDIEGSILTKERILEAKIVPTIYGYDILISYLDQGTRADYKELKEQKKSEQIKNNTKNNNNSTEEKSKTKQKLSEKEQNRILFEKLQEEHETNQTDLCLAGCDIGLNNIAALSGVNLSSNGAGITPLIVNGRHIKSINQYYNKHLASEKSQLSKNTGDKQKTSASIQKLTQKRNHKIHTELHKVSKCVVDWCKINNISCLIIGKNDNWKQDINLGPKTNQNFVSVPHAKLISMIKYKCERKGILVLTVEESYTSKCSFLDREELCSQRRVFVDNFGTIVQRECYQGKRVKRGLFRSGTGKLMNADTQASLNMIRKVAGDKVYTLNSVEDFAVNPLRVSLSA